VEVGADTGGDEEPSSSDSDIAPEPRESGAELTLVVSAGAPLIYAACETYTSPSSSSSSLALRLPLLFLAILLDLRCVPALARAERAF